MAVQVEFTTLAEMFERLSGAFAASGRPMLMAKVDGAYRGISYEEFHERSVTFANGLASLGVRRGDRIAVISENRPEWVIADSAMIRLGAVNVSLYPTLTAKQIEFMMSDSGASMAIVSNAMQLSKVLKIAPNLPALRKIILFSGAAAEEAQDRVIPYQEVMTAGERFQSEHPRHVEESAAAVRPDDILTIIYTSGTTGNPKGVVLTHDNLATNMKASAASIPFNHEDTLLSFLPLCHSYERMAGYYTAMACGVMIAYAESIESVQENLLEVRPTVMTTVPRLFERIYNKMMKQVAAAPRPRQAVFGWAVEVGKRRNRELAAGGVSAWTAVQDRVATALVFSKVRARVGGRLRFFVSGGAALPRELGLFFDAVGIRILEGYGMTESSPVISVNRLGAHRFGTVGFPIPGVEVRIAEDGEILARGPNVMRGYWNAPEATAEAIDADGWLHTGDVGSFDADGYLRITDRKKHLFVSSGGKNIAPQPIESLFLQNRYIDQFVLIGDARMYLTALIVPHYDVLREYARAHGAPDSPLEALLRHPAVTALYDAEIARLQKDLANFERVRKFTLLESPLTVEAGEITLIGKVRRKVVEEKYRPVIEKMYQGVS
jgi:long-chain acyl-CoA synthetase